MKVKVCCPHGGPSTERIVKHTGGSICVFAERPELRHWWWAGRGATCGGLSQEK